MKKWLLIISFLWVKMLVQAQTTIVQWNFNNNNTTPNVGAGTLANIGGVTNTFVSGTGSTDLAGTNNAYSSSSYPAVSANNIMAGIKMQVSTVGYQSIQLKFDHKNSNTAANTIVVKYSLDDITYTDVPGATYTVTNNSYDINKVADLSSIASVNNKTSVYIEIVTAFVGASYQPTNMGSTYASGGTIHFDMLTVSGISTTCSGAATVQAKNLQLIGSDASSMKMAFDRGNGAGCMVVARQGSAVNAVPSNGVIYTSSNIYTAGGQVGTGNYVVHNTTTQGAQQFTMTGLTAGTTYYFALFEYSQAGFCYLTPASTFSAVCNSTVLTPGDMLIVGYDGAVSSSSDKYILTNLVDLKQGTTFNIVNSRYEAGANANSRTNYWRGGSDDPFEDPCFATFVYTSALPLVKGSVISFEFNASVSNIQINGISSSALIATYDNFFSVGGLVSTTDPDQIYLTSGYFTGYGTVGIDRYDLLTGNVLCGITNSAAWVPFNNSVSDGLGGVGRFSRIPSQINCINVELATTNGFGYYAGSRSGTKAQIIAAFDLPANWVVGAGTGDDITANASGLFTVSGSNTNGIWKGQDNNWFNCKNWESLAVPDENTDVTIPVTTNNPNIDAKLGAEYDSVALTNKLTIAATLTLAGTLKDRLHIYDSLVIENAGTLQSKNSNIGEIDTVLLYGNLWDKNTSNITKGLKLVDKAILVIGYNPNNTATQLYLNASTPVTPDSLYAFTVNNQAGVNIFKGGFETIYQLNLINGFVTYNGINAFHNIGPNCIIKNPANSFGETDRGWEGSYFDARVNVKTNSIRAYPAPVGSTAQGIYAPVVLEPDLPASRTYSVSYIPTSHTNVAPADVEGFDHVSQLEYWKILCTNAFPSAKLTLYYTPYSRVGDGFASNDVTNMQDLRIAQYYNDISGYKWRLFGSMPYNNYSFITGSTVQKGALHYTQYATNFASDAQNFTLASVNQLSTLPVHLVSFGVNEVSHQVKLWWQVTAENETSFYKIEKSMDGRNFLVLQKTNARNQLGIVDYILYDAAPADGWNYYRLVVTDRYGKSITYQTEKVYIHLKEQFTISTNPGSGNINIQLRKANGQLELFDIAGKKYMQVKVIQKNMVVNMANLPKGVYMMVYYNEGVRQTKKIVYNN